MVGTKKKEDNLNFVRHTSITCHHPLSQIMYIYIYEYKYIYRLFWPKLSRSTTFYDIYEETI